MSSPASTNGRRSAALTRRAFAWLMLGGLGAATVVTRRVLRRELDDEEGEQGPSSVANARALAPYRAPVFAAGAPALSFLALGDTGWAGPILDGVAASMDRHAGALPFSFVCLLGDNFYQDGVGSARDPRWESGFERAFRGERLAVPFRAALGNHDHNGNVVAQVEYSALSSRWRMPGQYYSFVEPAGADATAEFFVLDTEALRREERESTEQLGWFEEKLASSDARWKIVIGHHPVRSNGVHGSIDRVRRALEELLVRHGAALYLSGHDHDLELLDSGRGFLQLVSGAGSSTRSMRWGADTLFASASPGHAWVGVERDELTIAFVESERGPVFARAFRHQDLVARAGAPDRFEAASAH